MTFHRARKTAEKAQRKTQLLDAARRMLGTGADVSLSALAREAGMAKSNVYRYFESREAVLLTILTAEWDAWADDVLAGLSTAGDGPEGLARLLAKTCAARPILCELTSILPSTLEHNISVDSVGQFKAATIAIIDDVSQGIHNKRPELSLANYAELFRHAIPVIIGLWPMSNPSPVVLEVLANEEMARFRNNFEKDLARTLTLVLRGLAKT